MPFLCFSSRDRVATRGFTGTGMFDTFWTWPLWSSPWTSEIIAAALSLPELQSESVTGDDVRGRGIAAVFRSQRILVGKTPNLTRATLVG